MISDLLSIKPDPMFLSKLKRDLEQLEFDEENEISVALIDIRKRLENGEISDLSDFLLIEYTRLFRGIKRRYSPPPPYESIYRGERNVIGEVTLNVIKQYKESGFIFDKYSGPKDNISTEIRFLSYLTNKEKLAWKNKDNEAAKQWLQKQKKFLENHLLWFAKKLEEEIKKVSKDSFYRCVANITRLHVDQDIANINYLLEEIDS
jgi:TorA maturation chaperone TorD